MRAWLATQHGLVAELALDELDDIIRNSEEMEKSTRRISQRVRAVAPALLTLPGCAELTAAKIVAQVANVNRFRSDAAFARYAGLAPTPYTSGGSSVRMQSGKHGNRHLNPALHRIAVTQIRMAALGEHIFR
ncbi:MAG TPA: IS110 family transposase [Williamsia sp.]